MRRSSLIVADKTYYVFIGATALTGVASFDTKGVIEYGTSTCAPKPTPLLATANFASNTFSVLFSHDVTAAAGTATLACTGADGDMDGVDDTLDYLDTLASGTSDVFGASLCGSSAGHPSMQDPDATSSTFDADAAYGCRVTITPGFTLTTATRCTVQFSDGAFTSGGVSYDRENSRGKTLSLGAAPLAVQSFSPTITSSASSLEIDVALDECHFGLLLRLRSVEIPGVTRRG